MGFQDICGQLTAGFAAVLARQATLQLLEGAVVACWEQLSLLLGKGLASSLLSTAESFSTFFLLPFEGLFSFVKSIVVG